MYRSSALFQSGLEGLDTSCQLICIVLTFHAQYRLVAGFSILIEPIKPIKPIEVDNLLLYGYTRPTQDL